MFLGEYSEKVVRILGLECEGEISCAVGTPECLKFKAEACPLCLLQTGPLVL